MCPPTPLGGSQGLGKAVISLSVFVFVFVFLFSLKVNLTNLCQMCIERDVDQWVWILPLLHSSAAPLQQEHKLLEEDVWAGLEGLPFTETRKKRDV